MSIEFSIFPSELTALAEIAAPQELAPEPVYVGRAVQDTAAIVVAPGEYQIDLRGPYFIVGDPSIDHELGGGEHVVRYATGATLVGRVTDRSGRPIAGARVAAALGGFAQRRSAPPETTRAHYRVTNTDATGAYRLEGLVVGNSVYVAAGAPGYATARTANAEVHAGENSIPVLNLEPEAVIQVLLRDALGTLGAGDTVVLAPRDEFLMNVERRVSVGDARDFAFTGLPGGEFRVELRGERAVSAAQNVRVETGTVATVLLDAQPAHPLVAVVTDSRNEPIPGAVVRVQSGRGSIKLASDDQGKFMVALAPDGQAEVEVSARGYLLARRTVVPAEMADGQMLHIVLEPGAVLRLELGERVANADSVRVECSFRVDETQLADRRLFDLKPEGGTVEFGGFTSGRAWGLVMVPEKNLIGAFDVKLPPESVAASPTVVRVDLEEAVEIHGLIIGRDDLPVASANVKVIYGLEVARPLLAGLFAASPVQSTTDGSFIVQGVLQREATLRVQAEGYQVVDVDLTHQNPRNVVVKLDH